MNFISLKNLFRDSQSTSPLVKLENSLEFSALLSRIGFRVISAIFPRTVKFRARMNHLYSFGKHLFRIRKNHGSVFTVKLLKANQLALQKFIAGNSFKSLREIEPDLPLLRLNKGLPSIIPLSDRKLIRMGSSSVIRYWNTLFSLYRIISIPGKLKLETITDPLTVNVSNVEGLEAPLVSLTKEVSQIFNFGSIKSRVIRLRFLESASSSHRVSWIGLFRDLFTIRSMRPSLYQDILRFISYYKGSGNLIKLFDCIPGVLTGVPFRNSDILKESSRLGQLSIKEEAAGKLRVFAMVDNLTQLCLAPLHEYLFDILAKFPNDGTFDQRASVLRAFEKSKVSGCSFGYDLTAATDRLPVLLQRFIIGALVDHDFGRLWSRILIDRDYILPKSKNNPEQKVLRYAVGQPMGALSSWAMLAITHHFIVQLCYRFVYPLKGGWFDNYELLGDDIVLFDELVANRYLQFMELIGVPINLSKSVIACKPVVEFAKVTGLNGIDVSPISWRMFISQRSWLGRANILYSLLQKFPIPNPTRYLSRVARKTKYSEGSLDYTRSALLTMFLKDSSFEDLFKGIISKDKPFVTVLGKLLLCTSVDGNQNLTELVRGKPLTFSKKAKDYYNVNAQWILSALGRRLQKWINVSPEFLSYRLGESILREVFDLSKYSQELFFLSYTPRDEVERAIQILWRIYSVNLWAELRFNLEPVINIQHKKVLEWSFRHWGLSCTLSPNEVYKLKLKVDSAKSFLDILQRAKLSGAVYKKVIPAPTDVNAVRLLESILKEKPAWPQIWVRRI